MEKEVVNFGKELIQTEIHQISCAALMQIKESLYKHLHKLQSKIFKLSFLKMENHYVDVSHDEVGENPRRQPSWDSPNCFDYYILMTTALTTLMGGFLLNDILDGKDQPDCGGIIMTIRYYSNYLLIDGLAQLIICLFVICILSQFKKFDSKKEVSRQLLFQVIDTGFSIIALVTIEVLLQYKQHCISYGVIVFLMMYSFWIYLLFFILVVAKLNQ